jgi:hypothetical protein
MRTRDRARYLVAIAVVGVSSACGTADNGAAGPPAPTSPVTTDAHGDGNRYRAVIGAGWFPNNADSLDFLLTESSMIVLGAVEQAQLGTTIPQDDGSGTVYYADVAIDVAETLRSTDAAHEEAMADPEAVHVTFFLGFEATVLEDLRAALPQGEAVWFLQSSDDLISKLATAAGRPRESLPDSTIPGFLLTDVDAGIAVEATDGTVHFPLIEPDPPDAGDHATPHEEPEEHDFPRSEQGVLPMIDLLSAARGT